MKFANVLNKPYKYMYLSKDNQYLNMYNIFYLNTDKNYLKLKYSFNLNKKRLYKISYKFSKNFYKIFLIIKYLTFKLDIKLIKIGLTKTLKQSRYFIRYNKILINGTLCKNPNFILKVGDYIQLIPSLYNKKLYSNLYLFKNYLLYFNKFYTNTYNNIININKNIFYVTND